MVQAAWSVRSRAALISVSTDADVAELALTPVVQPQELVRVPVLLVYGGRDLLVPADQGRRLNELLPASELLMLDRETHLSTPLAPAAIERLFAWIDRHTSTSPTAP